MRRISAGLLVIGLVAFSRAQVDAPAVKPVPHPIPGIERVLIIGIDGLRPDRLLFATAPVIRGLMKQGAYTMWMQTTASANTLPSFTSMLTAVAPAKHGITWNKVLKLQAPEWPARPTLFEMAHQGGYKTAMVVGKSKFRHWEKHPCRRQDGRARSPREKQSFIFLFLDRAPPRIQTQVLQKFPF